MKKPIKKKTKKPIEKKLEQKAVNETPDLSKAVEILVKMIHTKPEPQAERFHFGFGQVVLGSGEINNAEVLIITRARRSHLGLGEIDPASEPDYSHDGVELVFHNLESLQVLKGALIRIEEKMNAKS